MSILLMCVIVFPIPTMVFRSAPCNAFVIVWCHLSVPVQYGCNIFLDFYVELMGSWGLKRKYLSHSGPNVTKLS